MKATTVEAASAKAAPMAATAAASERHSRLNQADSRQCEQSYKYFPHHASSIETISFPRVDTFLGGIIRQSKRVRAQLTVNRG
jgi:hypothetical protein